MTDQLLTSVTTVLLAIVGIAFVAVLVSKNANTSGVIGASSSGFAGAIGAATGPITGSGYGGLNLSGFSAGAA